MTILESQLKRDESFDLRMEHWRREMELLAETEEQIRGGGGPRRRERQRQKGKMLARERIDALCDEGSFIEWGLWAGWEMYEEHGGAPAGGVVTGTGQIHGREVLVVANDATVKAGAWFPIKASFLEDRTQAPPSREKIQGHRYRLWGVRGVGSRHFQQRVIQSRV